MIPFLDNWLRTLIAGAFLVSLLQVLAPEGKGKEALRFLTGVLMTLLLLLPFLKTETGLADLIDSERLHISALKEEAAEQEERVYSLFIQRETEEYIWNAAGELGIETLGVSLTLDMDAACPCPREISLRGVYSESQQEALSLLLHSELGLSPEHQHWSRTDAD